MEEKKIAINKSKFILLTLTILVGNTLLLLGVTDLFKEPLFQSKNMVVILLMAFSLVVFSGWITGKWLKK
ncbi:MAG: hypothetical protein AAFX87_25505 [Bacteroidota bacterium]